MTVAKTLRARSEQARAKAQAAADAATRNYWLGISKAWEAMSEIHEQDRGTNFDQIQIEAVRMQVEEARARVHAQMKEVEELRRQGSLTPSANGMLHTLCESLSLHSECLERLIREYRKKRPR
jgi:hypothetical protein